MTDSTAPVADAAANSRSLPRPRAKPPVRKLAKTLGVDLDQLGAGPAPITRDEVLRAARAAGRVDDALPEGVLSSIPMRGVRRAIAANVARSRREIPEATTWVDVDATDLWQLRTELIEATGVRISPFAIICRAVVAALHVFPILNSRLDDDGKHIHVLEHVHLGIAASTDHGLVVPVVRDAHRRTILELAAETARLTECARAGSLTPADTTGSTFTVNNYGVLGVDGGDPIINLPEVAILGVGRIVDRPRVHDGQVVARKSVELVLAFDHRVCDGKEAGGFLRLLADMIEDSRTLVAAL